MASDKQLILKSSGPPVPWLSGAPLYANSFRCNVKDFLQRFGRKVPLNGLRRATAYVVELHSSQGATRLHVYEEKLDEKDGAVCDQCRCMGWQNHPVCNSKYHFIIPSEATLEDTRQLTAVVEGIYLKRLPLTHKWTAPAAEEQDHDEAGPYNAAASVFESSDHLLHGVLHLNGYGHLLRMNGSQGGSRVLIGKQLLTIWDRICTLLRAREVSTEDVSNKSGMLLRVLHTAAYGKTWYGKMGYGFGRGSFNIKPEQYAAAVIALQETPLSAITADLHTVKQLDSKTCNTLLAILQHYTVAPQHGDTLTTLGQLLQRMLTWCSSPEQYATLYPAPKGWIEPPPYSQLLLTEGRPRSAGAKGGKRGRSQTASPLPGSLAPAVKPEHNLATSAQSASSGWRSATATPRDAPVPSPLSSAAVATGSSGVGQPWSMTPAVSAAGRSAFLMTYSSQGFPAFHEQGLGMTSAANSLMGLPTVLPATAAAAAGSIAIGGSGHWVTGGVEIGGVMPHSGTSRSRGRGRGAGHNRGAADAAGACAKSAALTEGIRHSSRVQSHAAGVSDAFQATAAGFVVKEERDVSVPDVALAQTTAGAVPHSKAGQLVSESVADHVAQPFNPNFPVQQQQQEQRQSVPAGDTLAAALAAAAALSFAAAAPAAPLDASTDPGIEEPPLSAVPGVSPVSTAEHVDLGAQHVSATVPAAAMPSIAEAAAPTAIGTQAAMASTSQDCAAVGWQRAAAMLGISGDDSSITQPPPAKRMRFRYSAAVAGYGVPAAAETHPAAARSELDNCGDGDEQQQQAGLVLAGVGGTKQEAAEQQGLDLPQQGDLQHQQAVVEQQEHESLQWPGVYPHKGSRSQRIPPWRKMMRSEQQQQQQQHLQATASADCNAPVELLSEAQQKQQGFAATAATEAASARLEALRNVADAASSQRTSVSQHSQGNAGAAAVLGDQGVAGDSASASLPGPIVPAEVEPVKQAETAPDNVPVASEYEKHHLATNQQADGEAGSLAEFATFNTTSAAAAGLQHMEVEAAAVAAAAPEQEPATEAPPPTAVMDQSSSQLPCSINPEWSALHTRPNGDALMDVRAAAVDAEAGTGAASMQVDEASPEPAAGSRFFQYGAAIPGFVYADHSESPMQVDQTAIPGSATDAFNQPGVVLTSTAEVSASLQEPATQAAAVSVPPLQVTAELAAVQPDAVAAAQAKDEEGLGATVATLSTAVDAAVPDQVEVHHGQAAVEAVTEALSHSADKAATEVTAVLQEAVPAAEPVAAFDAALPATAAAADAEQHVVIEELLTAEVPVEQRRQQQQEMVLHNQQAVGRSAEQQQDLELQQQEEPHCVEPQQEHAVAADAAPTTGTAGDVNTGTVNLDKQQQQNQQLEHPQQHLEHLIEQQQQKQQSHEQVLEAVPEDDVAASAPSETEFNHPNAPVASNTLAASVMQSPGDSAAAPAGSHYEVLAAEGHLDEQTVVQTAIESRPVPAAGAIADAVDVAASELVAAAAAPVEEATAAACEPDIHAADETTITAAADIATAANEEEATGAAAEETVAGAAENAPAAAARETDDEAAAFAGELRQDAAAGSNEQEATAATATAATAAGKMTAVKARSGRAGRNRKRTAKASASTNSRVARQPDAQETAVAQTEEQESQLEASEQQQHAVVAQPQPQQEQELQEVPSTAAGGNGRKPAGTAGRRSSRRDRGAAVAAAAAAEAAAVAPARRTRRRAEQPHQDQQEQDNQVAGGTAAATGTETPLDQPTADTPAQAGLGNNVATQQQDGQQQLVQEPAGPASAAGQTAAAVTGPVCPAAKKKASRGNKGSRCTAAAAPTAVVNALSATPAADAADKNAAETDADAAACTPVSASQKLAAGDAAADTCSGGSSHRKKDWSVMQFLPRRATRHGPSATDTEDEALHSQPVFNAAASLSVMQEKLEEQVPNNKKTAAAKRKRDKQSQLAPEASVTVGPEVKQETDQKPQRKGRKQQQQQQKQQYEQGGAYLDTQAAAAAVQPKRQQKSKKQQKAGQAQHALDEPADKAAEPNLDEAAAAATAASAVPVKHEGKHKDWSYMQFTPRRGTRAHHAAADADEVPDSQPAAATAAAGEPAAERLKPKLTARAKAAAKRKQKKQQAAAAQSTASDAAPESQTLEQQAGGSVDENQIVPQQVATDAEVHGEQLAETQKPVESVEAQKPETLSDVAAAAAAAVDAAAAVQQPRVAARPASRRKPQKGKQQGVVASSAEQQQQGSVAPSTQQQQQQEDAVLQADNAHQQQPDLAAGSVPHAEPVVGVKQVVADALPEDPLADPAAACPAAAEPIRFSSRRRSPSVWLKDSVTPAVSAAAAARATAQRQQQQQQQSTPAAAAAASKAADSNPQADAMLVQQQQQQQQQQMPEASNSASKSAAETEVTIKQEQEHEAANQDAAPAAAGHDSTAAGASDQAQLVREQQHSALAALAEVAGATAEAVDASPDATAAAPAAAAAGGGTSRVSASGSGATTTTSGSSKQGGQKKRKKSTLTIKTKKRGWRWVVKPQYVLDEEAAKKAWQAAAKAAKEPGAGPEQVAAAEAAYQIYQAKKAITEYELANYKEEPKSEKQQQQQQPDKQLMPPPPPGKAAAAASAGTDKKLKLKFKPPSSVKSSAVKSAAVAAGKARTTAARSAADRAQELAADAAHFMGAMELAASEAAAAAAAAGECNDPAAAALLGVSSHGRKRKASAAVRQAVEDASEAAASRHSKRMRVRTSYTQFDDGDSAGGNTAAAGKGSGLLAGLGSKGFVAAAAAASGLADEAATERHQRQQHAAKVDSDHVGQRKMVTAVRRNPRKKSAQGKSSADGDTGDSDYGPPAAAAGSSGGTYRHSRMLYQPRQTVEDDTQGDAGAMQTSSRAYGAEPPAVLPEPHHPQLRPGLKPRSVTGIRVVDQVLADLQFVYNNVLRLYWPQQLLDDAQQQQQQQQPRGVKQAARTAAGKFMNLNAAAVKHDRVAAVAAEELHSRDTTPSHSAASSDKNLQHTQQQLGSEDEVIPQQQEQQQQQQQQSAAPSSHFENAFCANCGVTSTCCWRKDRHEPGRQLCNRCGVYKYKRGADRPLASGEGSKGSGGRKAAAGSSKLGPKGGQNKQQQQQPEQQEDTVPAVGLSAGAATAAEAECAAVLPAAECADDGTAAQTAEAVCPAAADSLAAPAVKEPVVNTEFTPQLIVEVTEPAPEGGVPVADEAAPAAAAAAAVQSVAEAAVLNDAMVTELALVEASVHDVVAAAAEADEMMTSSKSQSLEAQQEQKVDMEAPAAAAAVASVQPAAGLDVKPASAAAGSSDVEMAAAPAVHDESYAALAVEEPDRAAAAAACEDDSNADHMVIETENAPAEATVQHSEPAAVPAVGKAEATLEAAAAAATNGVHVSVSAQEVTEAPPAVEAAALDNAGNVVVPSAAAEQAATALTVDDKNDKTVGDSAAAAVTTEAAAVAVVPKSELQLKDFSKLVQTVRDIKHFVKDYKGELPPEGYGAVQQAELLQQQNERHKLLLQQQALLLQQLQQQQRLLYQQQQQQQHCYPSSQPLSSPTVVQPDIAAALAAAAAASAQGAGNAEPSVSAEVLPKERHQQQVSTLTTAPESMDVDMESAAAIPADADHEVPPTSGSESDELVVPEQPEEQQLEQQQEQPMVLPAEVVTHLQQQQEQHEVLSVNPASQWPAGESLAVEQVVTEPVAPSDQQQQQQQQQDQLRVTAAELQSANAAAAAAVADSMQIDLPPPPVQQWQSAMQQPSVPAVQSMSTCGPLLFVNSAAAAASMPAMPSLLPAAAAASGYRALYSTAGGVLSPVGTLLQRAVAPPVPRPISPALAAAAAAATIMQPPLRLLVQLDLTASGLLDVCVVQLPNKQLHRRQKQVHITPAELVLLPAGSSLAEAKRLVTEAFAETYRLAEHWKCEQLVGWPEGALVVPTAAADGGGGSAEGAAAASSGVAVDDALVMVAGDKVPEGQLLTAVGSNLNPERRFRHAGGVEDWAVNCSCGTTDDDGERMIVCDGCGFWMHTRCVGLIYEEDDQLPQHFTCQGCRESLAAAAAAEEAVVTVAGGSGLGKRGRC